VDKKYFPIVIILVLIAVVVLGVTVPPFVIKEFGSLGLPTPGP